MSVNAQQEAPPATPGWGAWPVPGAPLPGPDAVRLLRCEGSLTEALREYSADRFSLRVQRQTRVRFDQLQAGRLSGAHGIVREVVLCGDQVPWVFAQTLLPDDTVEQEQWLCNLDGRPLGDALFRRDDVVRAPLEFACLRAGQPLYARAAALGLTVQDAPLFARRSCFFANGAPLLVTEVFLPALCPIL